MWIGRATAWTIAILAAAGLFLPAPDASAVVVCQRKKKLTLRPGPECRKKEQRILDLDTLAVGSTVDGLAAGLDGVVSAREAELDLLCPAAPARRLAPGGNAGGCAIHDGDPAACDTAFEDTYDGAESCFYHAGTCLPCDGSARAGACVNACNPPACPAAPSRRYAGDAEYSACEFQPTQADCEAAFETDDRFHNGIATARPQGCFWDVAANACRGCSPTRERTGACANACGIPAVTCASRPGDAVPGCFGLSQATCAASWVAAGESFPMPCWWNTATSTCNECRARNEFITKTCVNDC